MNEALSLLLTGLAGGLLGVIFFGGLWWTVRKGLTSKQPAIWFLGSMLFRTAVVVTGFYFVANQRMERLLVCLLGFIMARLLITQMTRIAGERHPPEEARHAP